MLPFYHICWTMPLSIYIHMFFLSHLRIRCDMIPLNPQTLHCGFLKNKGSTMIRFRKLTSTQYHHLIKVLIQILPVVPCCPRKFHIISCSHELYVSLVSFIQDQSHHLYLSFLISTFWRPQTTIECPSVQCSGCFLMIIFKLCILLAGMPKTWCYVFLTTLYQETHVINLSCYWWC